MTSVGRGSPQGTPDEFHTTVDVDLLEDMGEVGLDRLRRDEHALGDLAIAEAIGGQLPDLPLRGGERWPASRRAAAGAARAARPLERVLCAQLSALGARHRIGAVG